MIHRWPVLARLLLSAAIVSSPGTSASIEKTLQNDSFSGTGDLVCIPGFAVGEIGAARFSPQPEDYPFIIKKVQLILCPDGPPVDLVLNIWHDDGTSVNPGTSLFAEFVTFTPSTTLLNEVDLTIDDIVVHSGEVRVGIEFFNFGSPPGLARDLDGINLETNFVFAVPPAQWIFAENLGVTGDWIIRLVIEANDAPPIFTDGFESGDTDGWSNRIP
jgi:hypothetical protein